MFEISWSELLILGIVTLIFVGPKELPVFLRTLGRYAGSIKRQAADFRTQFDAAMREAELDTMKQEVEAMQVSVNAEIMSAKNSFEAASEEPRMMPLPQSAAEHTAPAASPRANTTNPPMPATPMMPPPSSTAAQTEA